MSRQCEQAMDSRLLSIRTSQCNSIRAQTEALLMVRVTTAPKQHRYSYVKDKHRQIRQHRLRQQLQGAGGAPPSASTGAAPRPLHPAQGADGAKGRAVSAAAAAVGAEAATRPVSPAGAKHGQLQGVAAAGGAAWAANLHALHLVLPLQRGRILNFPDFSPNATRGFLSEDNKAFLL